MKEYIADPIHDFTFKNRSAVRASTSVGCAYCEEVMASRDIISWTDESIYPARNGTAICPLCSVDAVVPDSKIELSARLLQELHRYWFRRT